MPTEILHVRTHLTLSEVSKEVFRLLEVQNYERHESDNYVNGEYFRGKKGDVTVKVTSEDEIGFDDYQFWVVLTGHSIAALDLVAKADEAALTLLRGGYEVCRSLFDKGDLPARQIYLLGASGELMKKNEPIAV